MLRAGLITVQRFPNMYDTIVIPARNPAKITIMATFTVGICGPVSPRIMIIAARKTPITAPR
jgi:hypothetical protein